MTSKPPSPQPPPERRAAEAVLRGLIGTHAPAHARLFASTRRVLRKRLPTAHELVYEYRDAVVVSFSPSGHGHEGVFAIRAAAEGVRLYLTRAKGLPDPERLLRGTAGARWVDVDRAATLTRPAVASLIDAAIAANRVPFEKAGGGSIIVRTTKASTRPKARRGGAKAVPRTSVR